MKKTQGETLTTFGAVRRHYDRVEIEISNSRPLDATGLRPPIVIVPMNEWNKMSQKGLRFALKLSPDIIVVINVPWYLSI